MYIIRVKRIPTRFNPNANKHPNPERIQTNIAVVILLILSAEFLNIIPAPIKPDPQTT